MRKRAEQLFQHYQGVRESEEGLEAAAAPENIDDLSARVKTAHIKATPKELETAVRAQQKMIANQEPDDAELDALEAIILPAERPVVDITEGTFGDIPAPFAHFGTDEAIRGRIENVVPAVGRIGLPDRPDIPFAGTGFVVGEGVMMTNRHVAQLFAQGLGRERLQFINGQSADVNFTHELGQEVGQDFTIEKILMVHPYWDMALIQAGGLSVDALKILAEDPNDLNGNDIVVMGYPAFDSRNDAELQFRIFRGSFNVKRLQPGRLKPRAKIRSFGNRVDAAAHDCSTLGGNSGSCVVDVNTGKVIALHFAGRYLEANYAVPMSELARDARVYDAGVGFETPRPSSLPPWESHWRRADPAKEAPDTATPIVDTSGAAGSQIATTSTDEECVWTIPFEVRMHIGRPTKAHGGASGGGATVAEAQIEAMVEPFHEETYDNREGYKADFLGPTVALPTVADTNILSKLDNGDHIIPYQHFSLAVHKKRRIALFTACNVDGLPEFRKPDPSKSYTRKALSGLGENDREMWFTDPRIPALHQLPDRFFNKDRTAFDKGHLVRRDAVAWGETYTELRRANGDTYHVTNCSPQVKQFNRSNLGGLWGKLENLALSQVEQDHDIYSVFSGPILTDEDEPFAGVDNVGKISVLIPGAYWKIIVAPNEARDDLETFAFRIAQDLGDVDFGEPEEGVEFALPDIWQGRLVSVADLEEEIGLLTFPKIMHETDQFDADVNESLQGALI